MDSQPREVSTRQVRLAMVLIGALVLTIVILTRRPDDTGPGVVEPVDTTPVVQTTPTLPDPESEFSHGLEDPDAQWRQAAEHAGITISDVNEALERADLALAEQRLIEPPGDNALDLYLAIQEFDPENEDAIEGLSLIRTILIARLNQALSKRELSAVEALFPSLDRIATDDHEIEELAAEISRIKLADELLKHAQKDRIAGKLVQPTGDNALARLLRVQELDPDNFDLGKALLGVERDLIDRALKSAQEHDFRAAENWIGWAIRVRNGSTGIDHASESIGEYKRIQVAQLATRTRQAMRNVQYPLAENGISRMGELGAEDTEVAALREELRVSRIYGIFQPGQVFRDPLIGGSATGPEMVVVPHGVFTMGSEPGEDGHSSHEEPRHEVVFSQGFALSSSEISVAMFRDFVEQTGYQTDAERDGFTSIYSERNGRNTRSNKAIWRDGFNGRGAKDDEPVVHVSWNDATAFVAWLRDRTGNLYRLPSEAEFEFALRAGSEKPFWWGEGSPEAVVENTTGDGDRSSRKHSWTKAFSDYTDGYWGPAPVGRFQPNDYRLFDMAGNVQEWVEDCWHDSYVRAPADGRAWVNRGCGRRVVRGGFWGGEPLTARSAYRTHHAANLRGSAIGFRVARDLQGQPSTFVSVNEGGSGS